MHEIDYSLFQRQEKKTQLIKKGRNSHLRDRVETTETIHIVQPNLTLSVYHSTSNSSATENFTKTLR